MYQLPDLHAIDTRKKAIIQEFYRNGTDPEVRPALIEEVKGYVSVLDARLDQVTRSADGDQMRMLKNDLEVVVIDMENYK